MANYIKEDLLEFINQEYNEKFQKCWAGEDLEFWSMVVKTYFPDQVEQDMTNCKDFFMTQIQQQFKKMSLSVNRRAFADIYIARETTPTDILRYACQQLPMAVEDFLKDPNVGFNIKSLDLIRWTEPGSISMKYGDKASPKATETKGKPKTQRQPEILMREKRSEKEWAALSEEDFKVTKKPRGQTWADVYEKYYVGKFPKAGWVVGAMVDAVGRKEGTDLVHYGYIHRINYNRENRAILLEIIPFKGKQETWIWNGSAAKGSWLPQDELSRAKQMGGNAKNVKFRNLRVNEKSFTPTI